MKKVLSSSSSISISKLAWITADWVTSQSLVWSQDVVVEAVQFNEDYKAVNTAAWGADKEGDGSLLQQQTPIEWAKCIMNKPELVSGPGCIPRKTIWKWGKGVTWVVLRAATCIPRPFSVDDPDIVERLALSHLVEAARVRRWTKGQRDLRDAEEIGVFICDEMGSKRRLRPHEIGYVKFHTNDTCPMRHVPLSFVSKITKSACAETLPVLAKS